MLGSLSWISSMLALPKKIGKIRIYLDPKDLNKAILWENYPMPTIEEIATRLHGAKVFSVLNAKNGFWHVKLDEESSHLTTFHTLFGCYRWCRMPFGISSAPEGFQHHMHELIEGLSGIEVAADDFIVAGFGDTLEEAFRDQNKNLVAFFSSVQQVVSSSQWKNSPVLRGSSLNCSLWHQVWSENSS